METGTKQKILNVAEKLILELGEENVSLRRITAEAGVNVASINYHFGSRNNLISAIMNRFLEPLKNEMLQRLEDVENESGQSLPDLGDVLHGYIEPLLAFSERFPEYEKVFMLLARSYDDESVFKQNISQIVETTLLSYADCFVKIMPDLPRDKVLLRMAFLRNTSIGIMRGNCLMEESMRILGIDSDMDRNLMLDEMVVFLAAAFRA